MIEDSARLISPPGSRKEGLQAAAISMAQALEHLPKLKIGEPWVRGLRHGSLPPASELAIDPTLGETPLRLLGPENELIGMGRVETASEPDRESRPTLRLEKVF